MAEHNGSCCGRRCVLKTEVCQQADPFRIATLLETSPSRHSARSASTHSFISACHLPCTALPFARSSELRIVIAVPKLDKLDGAANVLLRYASLVNLAPDGTHIVTEHEHDNVKESGNEK